MAPNRLRVAVGIGVALLGLLGAVTGIFFTGITPDGALAHLPADQALPPALLLMVGGVLIAVTARRSV
jgi:hypothetical protein